MADNTKELIASSEFDPSNFVRGIDAMTASLEKLSKQEDQIKTELKNINTALATNRQEYKNTTTEISNLDKASKTYKDDLQRLTAQKKLLIAQQKELKVSMEAQKTSLVGVNTAANSYRASVEKITLVTKAAVAQGKGASFFDTVNLSKQVSEINAASGKLRNVFKGKISTEELDKFEQSLSETNDEFAQLGQVVTFVKSKLDTLDPNSEEFAELNRAVEVGEQVLDAYGKSTENVDKKSVSLRTRLAALRTALSDLESQGKDNTKEFEDMAIEAGRLQDQMEDTQQRIKVLASDTKALDFGIQAIRGVASAFGLAEGAAALFGLKSEDVAKSLQRLNAIMLILNGLQEIQTILQKQSTVAVLGQKAAVDGVTFALKSFKNALLVTGIGAVIVALGYLLTKFIQLSAATKDVGEEQKLLNEITKDAIKNYSTEVTRLELVRSKLNDLSLSQKKRIEIAKEYNKTAEEGNKIDLQQIDNIALVNRAIDSQIAKLKERAFARAAEAIIGQKAEAVLLAQEAARLKNLQLSIDATKQIEGVSETQFQNVGGKLIPIKTSATQLQAKQAADQIRFLAKLIEKDPDVIKAQKELQDALSVGAPLITPESLVSPVLKPETTQALKEIQNEFERKKAELDQQLAEATRKEADNESRIRVEFAARLAKEQADIQKLFQEKKLTAPQVEILSAEAVEINTAQLDNALKDFRDKVAKFRQDFDDKLFNLQLKAGTERAELIRDQFVREAELVKIESETQAQSLIDERDNLIKSIQDAPGIKPEIKEADIELVKNQYAKLLEILAEQTVRKQEQIAADTFAALQEETQNVFANVQLLVSETATEEIIQANEAFQDGAINYEKYQELLSEIATRETDRRIATALREAQALLTEVQTKIPTEKDPETLKQLKDQELELRNRIAALKREEALAEGDATNKDADARAKRIQELANYAQAIGGIISQVVGFWQQVNEAEQRSLERSISLQERRVEAAVKIAERGNSEYLRLEEDRLQELQTKQENAARRQIAINAVLQTSQALTAFISALAQGIALGGPLGGLAIATAVIAAIASGYAIVQSLQSRNAVTLKHGTKYLEGREHPDGVDTVPARLTKGEAVLPVDINREYHPTVKAIFDRKIPSQEINNFVNNYRVNSRVLPTVNYERMSEATQVMISYDGELLSATKEQTRKIEENTDLLGRVEYRLKTMGIEVNLDRNGLAVSLMKTVEQFKIDKRT